MNAGKVWKALDDEERKQVLSLVDQPCKMFEEYRYRVGMIMGLRFAKQAIKHGEESEE